MKEKEEWPNICLENKEKPEHYFFKKKFKIQPNMDFGASYSKTCGGPPTVW